MDAFALVSEGFQVGLHCETCSASSVQGVNSLSEMQFH